MASLFGSLFGRAIEKKETSIQNGQAQQYDREYIDYCIELEQTVTPARHQTDRMRLKYVCGSL